MSVERTSTFNLSLFGRFELVGPNGTIGLTSKKSAALLAYLATTYPAPHSRDKLMTLLWGTHFDTQARQNLRQAVAGLRQILGKDVIVNTGDMLSLRADTIACDVRRFEMLVRQGDHDRLNDALDLYRDRFLADLKLVEEGWTEWVNREQLRLEDAALQLAMSLGESALARNEYDRAITLAKRAIAIDALREDAHRLLMRATSVAGRKAEALQHYDTLFRLLKDELGVEPDATTSRLAAELRVKAEGIAPAPKAMPTVPRDERDRFQINWEPTQVRAVLALDETPSGHPQTDGGSAEGAGSKLADRFGARVVGREGGTLLLEFPDSRTAVRAAHDARADRLRMSAHASTSWAAAKDTAARLLLLAAPGDLVVSDEVCDALTDGIDALIEDLGEHSIGRGGQPVRAFLAGPRPAVAPSARLPADGHILPTIAVIPFGVSSADSTHVIVGQLLAHEIITRLSQTKDFTVISRLSTRSFCGRNAGLSEIGAWLGADYALWGDCFVSGDRVSVQAELANTESQRVVWADSRSAPLSAVQEGFSDLVADIVAEASASVFAHELEGAQTQPLESLENYSLLMTAINLVHRTSPTSFAQARKLLELLGERLPQHPLPQAWMARWHVMKVSQGWAENVDAEGQLALDCAKRATDSDQNCSIAIAMDGWVHTHLLKRFDIAAERFALAVEVNSNDSMAWLFKGAMHSFLGQGQDAVNAAERALRLSPLDPRRFHYDCLAASAYCAANEFEKAIELGKRSLRVNRLHASTLRSLTCSLALSGRVDEARQVAVELMKLEPKLTVTSYLSRHPAAPFWTGRAWADALRSAGVPD